ncbi:hypothetical protein BH11BAC3_BH11BAC3_01760 [soil metagenome]
MFRADNNYGIGESVARQKNILPANILHLLRKVRVRELLNLAENKTAKPAAHENPNTLHKKNRPLACLIPSATFNGNSITRRLPKVSFNSDFISFTLDKTKD